jgi:hypothetical protein
MNLRALLVCAFIIGNGGFALATAQRPSSAPPARVPAAPAKTLPPTLVRARTAFLINEAPGLDTDREFRELRTQLRLWDHFEVVDLANRADVTISLSTSQVERPGIETGAPIGAGFVNPSRGLVRRNVSKLTVRQRSTGEILWSGESASVTTVLQRLQQEMPRAPKVCFAFWCR